MVAENPAIRFPHYRSVPKDKVANLEFRRRIRELGYSDPEEAQAIWIACSRDLLFFINVFCYIFEPRKRDIRPFITYPFQDETLEEILDAIGYHDIDLFKSRDMGASWMAVAVVLWFTIFHPNSTFLALSQKQEMVDKKGDPKALMQKFDFMKKQLPSWLRPAADERTQLHYKNLDNESGFDGDSTTATSSTGDRRLAVILDEFSKNENQAAILQSSADVSECRIFIYSVWGSAESPSAKRAKSTTNKVCRLHWTKHPEKKRGMYTSVNGVLKILDTEYVFPEKYPFILDGKVRSPAYDYQESRRGPLEMAREWDMDWQAASSQFFDVQILDRIAANDVRPPFKVGNLHFDRDSLEPLGFKEFRGGMLRLWCSLDSRGRPAVSASNRFVAACDVSAGTGASNSVCSIANEDTGEKVAEFVSPRVRPEEFAKISIALCRWFYDAFLGWDAQGGLGRNFGQVVVEQGYRNIYYRPKNEKSITRQISNEPGVYTASEMRMVILNTYQEALNSGEYINRSEEAIKECHQYVFGANNRAYHMGSMGEDPSGAGENHGDRVIADAICAYLIRGRKSKHVDEPESVEAKPRVIPEESYYARMMKKRAQEAECALSY